MVRTSPANAALMGLCLAMQVVMTVLPQGATMCVGSLFVWPQVHPHTARAADLPFEQSCTCCDSARACADASDDHCPHDHAAGRSPDPTPAPGRSPCRDPKCMLCVRAPEAVLQQRIAPEGPTERVTWCPPPRAAWGSGVNGRCAPVHPRHPPPDMLGDRGRAIVGSVILQV